MNSCSNKYNMDFVIPLKKIGLFTRAVLEVLELFYHPRRILIITNKEEISILERELSYWNVGIVKLIEEESFFIANFNLTIDDLEREFNSFEKLKDEKHREFGWWYQQIIKLGVSSQIKDISEKYVVWDSDLIPLEKWELVVFKNSTENPQYHVAILQDQPKNEFNKEEYNKCLKDLLGFDSQTPYFGGTFVMHHMIFDVGHVKEMLNYIITKNNISELWPIYIISLSKRFYRFSEYMLYSLYMIKFHKDAFFYYPYEMYGKTGIRFRESNDIIKKINNFYSLKEDNYFSYQEIADYFCFFNKSNLKPSYVQFEHVYHIL